MKIKPGEWLQMDKMDRFISIYDAFLNNFKKQREDIKKQLCS
ncbi:hypothetical protein [Metabacillus fastidiosus]